MPPLRKAVSITHPSMQREREKCRAVYGWGETRLGKTWPASRPIPRSALAKSRVSSQSGSALAKEAGQQLFWPNSRSVLAQTLLDITRHSG